MKRQAKFGVDDYDQYWVDRKSKSQVRKTKIHDRITEIVRREVSSDTNVLDLGVGPGHVFHDLSADHNCYGVEISREIIDSYNFPTTSIIQADFFEGIPKFPVQGFDCIIASMVVHHAIDPDPFLQDIRKNLKENGRAIVVHPNTAYITDRINYFFRGVFPGVSKSHRIFLNYYEIRDRIEKNGLNITKCYPVGKLGFLRGMFPSLLSGAFFFVCTKK